MNNDHEIMMITTSGTIIQLRMEDISTFGRVTSGVKMINLDEGSKVAKIAKVREKVSDGDHEFDNFEDALENIPENEKNPVIPDGEEEVTLPKEEKEYMARRLAVRRIIIIRRQSGILSGRLRLILKTWMSDFCWQNIMTKTVSRRMQYRF